MKDTGEGQAGQRELSGRELDATVAEKVMGFQVEIKPAHKRLVEREDLVRWPNGVARLPHRYRKWKEDVDVPAEPWLTVAYKHSHGCPRFSTDLNACFEAQARCIEMVGWIVYGTALKGVVGCPDADDWHAGRDIKWNICWQDYRLLTTATAEQRCLAMLKATQIPADNNATASHQTEESRGENLEH